MKRPIRFLSTLTILFIVSACTNAPSDKKTYSSYQQLVDLFIEWREFHAPEMIDGMPDYSDDAMKKQFADLKSWQQRLQSYDTTGWPIKDQIDWYLVWAEMNGLDFEHRVTKPWVRDPAFYVWFYPYPSDVPEREGPNIYGAIELPRFGWPLSNDDAVEIAGRLRNIDQVYEQAKKNLTGNAKDLWITGKRTIDEQGDELESFAKLVEADHSDLAKAAREAKAVSDEFAKWVAEQTPTKNGLSGVGKENYSWNLKNVHLIPYTWEEEKLLMERELARSHSALRMSEHSNNDLPKLSKASTPEEYDKLINDGVDEFMQFLEQEEVISMKDYMEPAVRAQVGKFTPSDGMRGFFSEIDYRDPMPMRCHHYHWIDLAQMREKPHESLIRSTPLLYNIFDGRAEGMATAMEELMMHAGLLKNRPRATELVYIMLAQRAARGLGGLGQHGLEMTYDEACAYASKWVPWGLLPADGGTIQHEEQFYLQQPGYGTSYVIGKLEIDKLIAEYARQREEKFVLKDFMDDFADKGVIPVSIIYWEMTGDKSMLNRATQQ